MTAPSPVLSASNAANTISGADYAGVVVFGTNSIASQRGNGCTWERTGTGAYTVTFVRTTVKIDPLDGSIDVDNTATAFGWDLLLGAHGGMKRTSGAAYDLVVVDTSSLASAGQIDVQIRNGAFAIDPSNGDEMYYRFHVTDIGDLNPSS